MAMGEAKRRKLLDPNFGKDLFITFDLNGEEIKFVPRIVEGILELKDDENYKLELKGNKSELTLLNLMLDNVVDKILHKYNYEKIVYKILLDTRKFNIGSGKAILLLDLYPAYWDLAPYQLRERRQASLTVTPKEIQVSPVPKNEGDRKPIAEHVRKAHMRRVACGKNRADRRWVEIQETVVNAGV